MVPFATRQDADRAPVPVFGGGVSRASTMASGLLRSAFVAYLAVVLLSVLGVAPLRERWLSLGVLVLAALVAAYTWWPLLVARPQAERRVDSVLVHRVGYAALGLGLLVTAGALALAIWLPVGAYDALGYRLPAIAQWLDAGAVSWVQGDDPLRNGYPLGLEVIGAATFRALESPWAVDCLATGFVLAGAAALLGFARSQGLARSLSALAAGLFLLVPMHVLNAPSGYADAAFAGVLVTFLVWLARWCAHAAVQVEAHVELSRAMARSEQIDLGVAAALVTALKPHGIAFVMLGGALGLVLRAREAGLGRAAAELGLSASLAVAGLFFAVRNVVMTGNPLYPLELRVGKLVLFRGESSLDGILTPDFNVPPQLAALPTWLRAPWVWLQPYGPATEFDDRLSGFGYAFLLLGLPALAWLLRRLRRRSEALRGVAVVVGLTFSFWLLQPFSFWPRFTSWLWGAAALALALWIAGLLELGRSRGAVMVALSTLLLALPEALYALSHVKRVDRFGLSSSRDDAVGTLSRYAGVDVGFVRRVLVGKRDICRTPWRLGTDDANLDGIVAQLSPRPRMHVLKETALPSLLLSARKRGCEQLIVIGDNPVLATAPVSLRKRIETATAFGACRLIPVLSAEVTP